MKAIIGVIVIFLILVAIYVFVLGLAYLLRFKVKPCKYCGNFMEFRGEKERPEGNVYLFQCPNCKAWEEISVKDFNKSYKPETLIEDR